MQILLINKNPIVSKLFSLSAKGMEGIEIDEVEDIKGLPQESYDMLFVDDGDSLDDELEEFLYSIDAKQKILFVSNDDRSVEGVDEIIKKPFLPSTIISILQSSYGEESERVESDIEEFIVDNIEPSEEKRDHSDSLILDKAEIDKIKRLLLDSEDTIESEQEDTTQSDSAEIEERLIDALMDMKPKAIKRLLRGAEINISIKFPKGES
ncbi:highly acidic protein [hydrothermal vent metagenome]|uniref:Highly acidic protein n=1 Tax=hydrothermal vent metagenome TaxID=652676 RepID=A0A1W1BZ56_9ZZZZ